MIGAPGHLDGAAGQRESADPRAVCTRSQYKTQEHTEEFAMSKVYPRLYPALFFGLIAFNGYLLLSL